MSPAWFEATHGRLWEQGVEGIERYNELRKTEPMRRALEELGTRSWFAGLRREQSRSRRGIRPLEFVDSRWKVYPIFDWTDRDVYQYLRRHDLPYHPLWHEGYVSIGDWHSTRTLAEAILWHGGEGRKARDRFAGAAAADRDALVKFLESL